MDRELEKGIEIMRGRERKREWVNKTVREKEREGEIKMDREGEREKGGKRERER